MHSGIFRVGAATMGFGLAGALTMGMAPAPAQAAPCQVMTRGQGHYTNLQTAIDQAKPGATLMLRGTCAGGITITKDLTIRGLGKPPGNKGQHSGATISGGGPVITVDAGVTATLDQVTLKNGDTTAGNGGGIVNHGTLAVTDSLITDNFSGNGGGIFNEGTLDVQGTTISNNQVVSESVPEGATFGAGGAIFTVNSKVTLTDSTLSSNTASSGGGIFFEGGTVNLFNGDRVTQNTATAFGSGGGILVFNPVENSSGVFVNGTPVPWGTQIPAIVFQNTPNQISWQNQP